MRRALSARAALSAGEATVRSWPVLGRAFFTPFALLPANSSQKWNGLFVVNWQVYDDLIPTGASQG
jgi:hypothetical protein